MYTIQYIAVKTPYDQSPKIYGTYKYICDWLLSRLAISLITVYVVYVVLAKTFRSEISTFVVLRNKQFVRITFETKRK